MNERVRSLASVNIFGKLDASNKGGAPYVKVELLSYEGKTLATKNVYGQ
ncbi:hypothetical protein [Pseudonocardia sp. TRM90224]|nr:hypothetical protein [Pseudonocardia sp. TRM90224]